MQFGVEAARISHGDGAPLLRWVAVATDRSEDEVAKEIRQPFAWLWFHWFRLSTWTNAWLFQALSRAWPASIALIVVGFILWEVDQLREVLRGMTDPMVEPLAAAATAAVATVSDDIFPGFANFAVYWIASLLLAWTTRIGADLLTYTDARRHVPTFWRPEASRKWFRRPSEYPWQDWHLVPRYKLRALRGSSHLFPIAAAAFMLVVTQVAWLDALRPWMAASASWKPGLVAIVPLVLAMWCGPGRIRQSAALLGCGGSLVYLWIELMASRLIPAALCPAALSAISPTMYWLWCTRRVGSRRRGQLRRRARLSRSAWRPFALVGVPAIAIGVIGSLPPAAARGLGSASLILVMVSALLAGVAFVTVWVRVWTKGVPGLGLAVGALVVWLAHAAFTEGYGHEDLPLAATTALQGNIIGAVPPLGGPLPVARFGSPASDRTAGGAAPARLAPTRPWESVAIHADGGGLRAAYFTAQSMALADDLSCGEFGKHVFAASGVSGGSIGLATWAVLREEYLRRPGGLGWSGCVVQSPTFAQGTGSGKAPRVAGGREYPAGGPLSKLVTATLVQDHLSPVLAQMLSSDLLAFGDAPARRGQALLNSLQGAAREALQVPEGGFAGFSTSLKSVTAGMSGARPWLLFNATDADLGTLVVLSNAASLAEQGFGHDAIGVAALDSARFPIVSPAGYEERPAAFPDYKKTVRRLVDGGYFDNSGATALLRLLKDKATEKPPGNLHIVRLDGNVEASQDQCEAWLGTPAEPPSPPWSGSQAFAAMRTAHATEAVDILAHEASDMSALLGRRTHYLVDPPQSLSYEAGFDASCKRTFSYDVSGCGSANHDICVAALDARHAPLGWFLTPETARAMAPSVEAGAYGLLRAAGLGQP